MFPEGSPESSENHSRCKHTVRETASELAYTIAKAPHPPVAAPLTPETRQLTNQPPPKSNPRGPAGFRHTMQSVPLEQRNVVLTPVPRLSVQTAGAGSVTDMHERLGDEDQWRPIQLDTPAVVAILEKLHAFVETPNSLVELPTYGQTTCSSEWQVGYVRVLDKPVLLPPVPFGGQRPRLAQSDCIHSRSHEPMLHDTFKDCPHPAIGNLIVRITEGEERGRRYARTDVSCMGGPRFVGGPDHPQHRKPVTKTLDDVHRRISAPIVHNNQFPLEVHALPGQRLKLDADRIRRVKDGHDHTQLHGLPTAADGSSPAQRAQLSVRLIPASRSNPG